MKKTGYLSHRGGFKLVELLLVIGIIAVLFALILPLVRKNHENACRIQSENNLKQMAQAVHNLNDFYKHLPPAVGNFPEADLWFKQWGPPAPHGTLQYFMLPYLGQDCISKNQVWISRFSRDVVPIYIAPGDPTAPANALTWGNRGATSYAANWNVFGSKDGGDASIPRTFRHGTSSTVIFAERYCICTGKENPFTGQPGTQHIWAEDTQGSGPGSAGYAPEFHILNGPSGGRFPGTNATLPQWAPGDQQCNYLLLQSFFDAGITVAMGDGSVHFVSSSINQYSWTVAIDPKSMGL